MKRILLVGGGSGGHIYPLIAVAGELQKIAVEKTVKLELVAVADSDFWKEDFERLGVKFKKILITKFRQVEGGKINYLSFLTLPLALVQSLWLLFLFMPDAVLAKGGFASLIPSLAARLYFIPLFIHESDAVPGKANRFLARFAKKVFVSFEAAAGYFQNKNVILSGNPVRESLIQGDKAEAAGYFNFDPDKKTVLFLAGSQGARFINQLALSSLVKLTESYQIIHQAGPRNFESVKAETDKIKSEGSGSYGENVEKNYRLFPFLSEDELKNAYAVCDIVVARAGSNIFEIAAVAKPAIVVPYPYSAGNHQKQNALEFAKFGATAMEEKNLGVGTLISQINYLLKPENYSAVSQKIRQFAKSDAAKIIAQELISNV